MESIPAKTIVTRTKSNVWFGTDYNMNIYKGCCHGCIYCDSRSECYGVEEFDRVRVKKDALAIIGRELQSKAKKGVIGTGSMSDPYNPYEKEEELTRRALMLVAQHWFGIAIATKSDLITRDADLLAEIAEHAPVIAKVTVTTCSEELAGQIEPFAPSPSRRFGAVEALVKRGIFSGILLMPVLPFLTDSEQNILQIVRRAHASGAKFIYAAMGMTLRQNQRDWYLDQVGKRFPGLRERYERQYGLKYQCGARNARALWKTFAAACEQCGLLYRMEDIIEAYRGRYRKTQLSFL